MGQSSKLHRKLAQLFGALLGITIATYILRGLGILSFIPGGIIWLLFFATLGIGLLSYAQKTWWRF